MTVCVSEVIGSNSATIRDQGLLVYEIAKIEIENKREIIISFENINMVISSFLNASIGKLYGDFDFDDVDKLIKVEGLNNDDMELLELTVIPNAKDYYKDKEKISNIEKSILD